MPGVYMEDRRINLVKLEQESYAFFGDPFVFRQQENLRRILYPESVKCDHFRHIASAEPTPKTFELGSYLSLRATRLKFKSSKPLPVQDFNDP